MSKLSKTDKLIIKYKKSKDKLEYLRISYKYKDLGFVRGGKVLGFSYIGENRIEIDKSLEGKEQLEIFAHETLHQLLPCKKESDIDFMGKTLAEILWKAGYRKTKNEQHYLSITQGT